MVRIYSCHHKPYQQIQSDIIFPIQVGKAHSKINLGFQGDDSLKNISTKNPYFCELTATYWIWKNEKTDIVGLFHYRRFLNLKNNEIKVNQIHKNFANHYGLTKQNIQNILSEYDLILPEKIKITETNLYDHYKTNHHQSDIDLLLDIIKEKHPNDYKIAEQELKNNSEMFLGNIIIAHKKVFDLYAEWIFDILFEIENKIQSDVLKRDAYQQRVYGFLAERLMAIFVKTHPELKIKYQPLIFVEEDKKKYRKYKIKQTKRKILSLIGFRKKRWKI